MDKLIIHTYWTEKIFKQSRWASPKTALRFIEGLAAEVFNENNLIPKDQFINNLKLLVQSIESTGELLSETREMCSAGSIAENWFPGQRGSLRTEYIHERKKLKQQLELINLLFRPIKKTQTKT